MNTIMYTPSVFAMETSKYLAQVSPSILLLPPILVINIWSIRTIDLGLDTICSNRSSSQHLKTSIPQINDVAASIVDKMIGANTWIDSRYFTGGGMCSNLNVNLHGHAQVVATFECDQACLVLQLSRKGLLVTGGLELRGVKNVRLAVWLIAPLISRAPCICCCANKRG